MSLQTVPHIQRNLQKNLPSENNRVNESDPAGPAKPIKDITLGILEDHQSVLNRRVVSLDLYFKKILLVTLWGSQRTV